MRALARMTFLLALKEKELFFCIEKSYGHNILSACPIWATVIPNLTFTCPGQSGKCTCSTLLTLYLLWLFLWWVCSMSELGAVSKMKSCKIWLTVQRPWYFMVLWLWSVMLCVVALPKSAEIKHHALTFNYWCNFQTFDFWHCPQLTHPLHIAVK